MILVTGATGTVGGEVLKQALSALLTLAIIPPLLSLVVGTVERKRRPPGPEPVGAAAE